MQPWGERIPVGKDNLLLRECVVKNTDYVEGLVVYAGHESKAMLNNGGPRYKRSRLEKRINLDVIWCAVILVGLCLGGAIGSGTFTDSFVNNAPFLSLTQEDFLAQDPLWIGFLAFWTFIIILQVHCLIDEFDFKSFIISRSSYHCHCMLQLKLPSWFKFTSSTTTD